MNNMIIIEKIYVDNECSVIMLNLSAAPCMVQRHYGSRDCRPLRELRFSNQVNLWHSKRFVFYSFNLLAGNQFLKLSVFLRQIGKISEIFFPKEMNLKCYPCTLKSINYHPSTGHCQEYIHFD